MVVEVWKNDEPLLMMTTDAIYVDYQVKEVQVLDPVSQRWVVYDFETATRNEWGVSIRLAEE